MKAAYRLCSAKYRPDSGKGAALYGGRWNSVGIEVVYSASHISLAIVEVLVNSVTLPEDYALTSIEIPDNLIRLPYESDEFLLNDVFISRSVGDSWAKTEQSAVLSVPSSVVPAERNLVINPNHPDFHLILFNEPASFRFDPRLRSFHEPSYAKPRADPI